jgi:hypothetical protein
MAAVVLVGLGARKEGRGFSQIECRVSLGQGYERDKVGSQHRRARQ